MAKHTAAVFDVLERQASIAGRSTADVAADVVVEDAPKPTFRQVARTLNDLYRSGKIARWADPDGAPLWSWFFF